MIFYIYVKNANFALHHREKCRDGKDTNATLLLFTYCQQRDIKYREIIGELCMFLNSWNHQQFLMIKFNLQERSGFKHLPHFSHLSLGKNIINITLG